MRVDVHLVCYCYANVWNYFVEYIESFRSYVALMDVVLIEPGEDIIDRIIRLPTAVHLVVHTCVAEIRRVPDMWPVLRQRKCHVLNTEQMTRPHIHQTINRDAEMLPHCDYSLANIEHYTDPSSVIYMPYLVNDADCHEIPDKPHGVCAVGSTSHHRASVYEAIRAQGVEVQDIKGWGAARDDVLFRHKVLVNVHCDNTFRIFETVRCLRCLLNGVIVVSDRGEHDEWLEYHDCIIFTDDIPHTVKHVMDNYEEYRSKFIVDREAIKRRLWRSFRAAMALMMS